MRAPRSRAVRGHIVLVIEQNLPGPWTLELSADTLQQVEGPAPTASARASAAGSGTALSDRDGNDNSCELFRFEQLEIPELTLMIFVNVSEVIDTG